MALYDVPQAAQTLGVTQPLIRDNFNFINTDFAVNHVTLNSGANSGKHTRVTMPEQANDNPATLANELAIYAKQGTANPYGTIAGLFLQQESSARIIEWTGFGNAAALPGFTTRGYAVLPSGIIIKFGLRASAVTPHDFSLNGWGPNFAAENMYYITASTTTSTITNIVVSNGVATAVPSMRIAFSGGIPAAFYFLAIGRQV